jgi:ribose transport system permease protein
MSDMQNGSEESKVSSQRGHGATETLERDQPRQRPLKSLMSRLAFRYSLIGAWIVLGAFFSILMPDSFATLGNIQTMLSTQSVLVILTIGMLPGLAAGELDLSVASLMGIVIVVIGTLNVNHRWPVGAAVAAALVLALLVGLINTLFIVRFGIDSIVVTLGMGTLLTGAALGINNVAIGGISESLVTFARFRIFGLQAVFYYSLFLVFLLWYVFSYTPLGRYLYFVGSGREVARLTGIRVNAVRGSALICGSLFAGFAGVAQAGLLGGSDPSIGPTFIMPAFAGAFLGATVISPGRFNPWGTFVAVYFLVTGITGLELFGLSGWIDQVFYGASLLVAVAIARAFAVKRAT